MTKKKSYKRLIWAGILMGYGIFSTISGIALGSMMCFKDKLKEELTKKVKEERE